MSSASGLTKSPNPNAKIQDPTVDSADGSTSYVTRTSKLKKESDLQTYVPNSTSWGFVLLGAFSGDFPGFMQRAVIPFPCDLMPAGLATRDLGL